MHNYTEITVTFTARASSTAQAVNGKDIADFCTKGTISEHKHRLELFQGTRSFHSVHQHFTDLFITVGRKEQ
jgi:hypothetical protein